MTWRPLTARQHEILQFIAEFLRKQGYAPSLDETRRHFGLRSLATVHKHLVHLQEKGYLTRAWNRTRSIELKATGSCCPTCGQPMPTAATAHT